MRTTHVNVWGFHERTWEVSSPLLTFPYTDIYYLDRAQKRQIGVDNRQETVSVAPYLWRKTADFR